MPVFPCALDCSSGCLKHQCLYHFLICTLFSPPSLCSLHSWGLSDGLGVRNEAGAASLAFPLLPTSPPCGLPLEDLCSRSGELKFKGQGTSFIYLIMLPTKLDCK